MPDEALYQLTAKGQTEAADASSALPAPLGKLLRLIDGKTATAGLKAKFGRVTAAKLQGFLDQLANDGYIEPAAPAASAPGAGNMPDRPADGNPAAQAPAPDGADNELDFSSQLDQPANQPSAAQLAEAEQLTVAGMRTLKAAGFYVNILSKPGKLRPPRSGDKYTVLLLDHDAQSALHVGRALLLADFDVRSAENREQALVELKKTPLPDAIILDPKVPRLHGLELLARLQAHPAYGGIPVVVVTDDHQQAAVVNALARGAAGYMTKPLKMEVLLDNVRAVLGLK